MSENDPVSSVKFTSVAVALGGDIIVVDAHSINSADVTDLYVDGNDSASSVKP